MVMAKISIVTDSQSLCDVGGTQRVHSFRTLVHLLVLVERSFFQSSDSEKDWYCLIITWYRKTWVSWWLISLICRYCDYCILAVIQSFHAALEPVELKLQIIYLLLMERPSFSIAFFGMMIPFHHGKCCALVAPLVNTKLQLLFI